MKIVLDHNVLTTIFISQLPLDAKDLTIIVAKITSLRKRITDVYDCCSEEILPLWLGTWAIKDINKNNALESVTALDSWKNRNLVIADVFVKSVLESTLTLFKDELQELTSTANSFCEPGAISVRVHPAFARYLSIHDINLLPNEFITQQKNISLMYPTFLENKLRENNANSAADFVRTYCDNSLTIQRIYSLLKPTYIKKPRHRTRKATTGLLALSLRSSNQKAAKLSKLATKRTRISTQILSLCRYIKGDGFHNKSSYKPTAVQSLVLTLGLKFIPKPLPAPMESIIYDFDLLARRIRLKSQFASNTYNCTSTINSLLRVPNPNFQPSLASLLVEKYISDCRNRFILQQTDLHSTLAIYSLPRESLFTDVINSLNEIDSIVITQSDKNMGPAIVDKVWYESEALRQLRDDTTYKQIVTPPSVGSLKDSLILIFVKYNKMNSKISTFCLLPFEKYIDSEFVPGAYFYMLTKLHKPDPTPITGRPIVASLRSLTYNVSKFLDKYLQPLMKRFKSYLKNTFDIIEIIEEKTFPPTTIILTGDVNSLYPSIDLTDGLVAIREALTKFAYLPSDQINFIIDLLEWVLMNNYLTFGDTFWLQIKGTAMGTPVAVTFANIYLSILEHELLLKLPNESASVLNISSFLLYKRYIDDIVAFFPDKESALEFAKVFNLLRPNNIKVDFVISDTTGVILDITIFKGRRFNTSGHFDISLFQKSCNKYLYLPSFSFHRETIFSGFINSELQRIRLHCTDDIDFFRFKHQFYIHLTHRGYRKHFLDNIFESVYVRSELYIKRKLKKYVAKNCSPQRSVVFTTTFSPSQQLLNFQSILELNQDLSLDPLADYIFANRNPIVSFKKTKSFKELLIRSRYGFSVEDNVS